MTRKNRITIPKETTARVLFESDRTCCVCRIRSKPVQIHHLDDDPTNNSITNLAVLCFDCHRETMIRGGFDRKLDSDQIILYRKDWLQKVGKSRSREVAARDAIQARDHEDFALAMSLAEIYREAKAYVELAIHHNIFGNKELRDKYIEMALSQEETPDDDTVVFLRGLQGRPDLIPKDLIKRYLADLDEKHYWHTRARTLKTIGRNIEAVKDYIRSIQQSLDEDSYFSAAFYIKELGKSGLVNDLFVEALRNARESESLWWQVRSLQELGWKDELDDLLIENAENIECMPIDDDPVAENLKEMLALARGDFTTAAEHRKAGARRSSAYTKKPPKME